VVVATTGRTGHLDLSPKGDPPGFVRVLDEQTLALPDRAGNRRVDSLRNILENPSVGLIFLVPGEGETLRVGGKAAVVRDRGLRESMALNDRVPELALVITVERVFFHCGKCIVRSKLWENHRSEPPAPPRLNGWLRKLAQKPASP
jgi:uncharacterized protein